MIKQQFLLLKVKIKMKFYVAGVTQPNSMCVPALRRTQKIANMFSQINQDAQRALGDDVIVVIVMKEYELAYLAIEADEKNASIALFKNEISKYNNMILIPGSYATYAKYNNKGKLKAKITKVSANYSKQSTYAQLSQHWLFSSELDHFNEKIRSGSLDQCNYLQNCSYILTAANKIKFKKSVPCEERNNMLRDKINTIFYIGVSDPVKTVQAGGRDISIGLQICIEHSIAFDSIALPLKIKQPLIHVLISSPMPTMYQDRIYGALNIHMDRDGLSVYINSCHPRVSEIEAVESYLYITDENRMRHIQPAIITQPLTDTAMPIKQPNSNDLTSANIDVKRERDDVAVAADDSQPSLKRNK